MARKKPVKRAKRPVKGRQKRSIFSYPAVIFLLICSGIFLIGWTLKSGAVDILVTAKVSAAPVNQPAVITSPSDGAKFTAIPIPVSGTCPTNAAYVEIFDNDVMRGTAICGNGNTFSLSIDLFQGSNTLIAHVFNLTDDEGPVSTAVNVTYQPPNPPASGSPQPGGSGTTLPINPFMLKTTFVYKGFHIDDQVQWPIEITGGTAPYAVSVDWGDGTSDVISRPQAGQLILQHTYSQQGGYKNSYTIKVKASDAKGNNAFIQFFVIITPKDIKQAGIFNKTLPKISGGLNWLWLAWPLYLVIILMAISYKLGEKEELLVLRRRGLLKR